ncbi:MAG: hypothetical protein M3P49_00305 [Actinomycetota bacterium]|nr:hypothetical protein [Actinomycetota bacterium]
MARLKAWRKRVERAHGEVSCIWRKEEQERGVIHYHLLILAPSGVRVEELAGTMRKSWCAIAGDGSGWFRRHGFEIGPVRSWRAVCRYVSKPPQEGRASTGGRIWGVWRESLLPISWETIQVSRTDFLTLRRVLRRLSRPRTDRHRTRGHRWRFVRQYAFLAHEEIGRLLAWVRGNAS